MFITRTDSPALRLLSDELESWSQPETTTAYRLEMEAKRPIAELPCPPEEAPQEAKVITLVTRLRTRPRTHPMPALRRMAA